MNDDITPYDEGWSAGYYDENDDCPYEEGTSEHDEWHNGYRDGNWNS